MSRDGLLHYEPWGDASCSRIGCGDPATTHIAVSAEDEADGIGFTASCDQHRAEVPGDVLDEHPFEGCCNMPGGFFVWSRDGMPGRCDMPGEIDALAASAVAVLS